MGAPEVAPDGEVLHAFAEALAEAFPGIDYHDAGVHGTVVLAAAGQVLADHWYAKARAFRISADASRAKGNTALAGYERLDAHRALAVADEIARLCGSPSAPLDGDTECPK